VVPTIFHEDGALDLPGLRRVVDYLVDAEVDGMCALANYSEQFSLTDAERDEVAATVLEQVAGRVPVILTTSHFSTRIAVQRSRDAQRMGAAVVMLMPPFFGATLSVSGPDVVGFFAEVAAAIDIPIMVQDAPMSTTPLSAALLVDLVTRVSSVRYAKIEVPFAADKLAALVGALGDRLPGPFDGEESVTLICASAYREAMQLANKLSRLVVGREALDARLPDASHSPRKGDCADATTTRGGKRTVTAAPHRSSRPK